MRILQLIDSLRPGGSERMSVNLANLFTEKGIPNKLIVSRISGSMSHHLNCKEDLSVFSKVSTFDLLTLWKIGREARHFKPDIIHAHSTSIAWAIFLKWLVGNSKLIWHDHYGLNPFDGNRKFMKWLMPFIDGVVVVKPELESWCRLYLGSRNVDYLYNFPLLKQVEIPRQAGKILCLANFRRQKGHLTLLRAINQIHIEFPTVELHLVGMVIDQECYNELIAFVKKNNLGRCVHFHTDGEDTEMHLYSSEIGVLSSESEGLPLALLEYGLAGLAVISTAVGSCEEVIGGNENGIIISPSNTGMLVEALKKMIGGDISTKKMGMKFKQRVEQEFASERFWKGYKALIGTCK